MSGSLTPLVASALAAAVPLVLAALGELVTERAGVLNLGLEGMMLMGAVASFMAAAHGGGLGAGVLAGIGAGAAGALVFAVLTLSLQASQVATGLSLTIFGTGLSAFLGRDYVGSRARATFDDLPVPGLSDIPGIGPLFSLNAVGYFALVAIVAIAWFLYRTRLGLVVRTVGESPTVARSLGMRVARVRYGATLFGGAMAGLAGSYYALAQFKMWQEGLTSGNGWIALALVVFSTWRPVRVAVGALLFGGVTAMGLYLQTIGIQVSTFLLASLPYLATIVVLIATSANEQARRRNAPAALGKPFFDGD
ncbi:MAG TPA: ABC transporter permease [Burkholderiaceae bacterium]|nr:ABC transporter permease [Burkholderiaceae bacterium]